MTNIAYIGIGSNIGDRFGYLKQAVSLLNESDNIKVEKVSTVYETAPVGYVEQASFLNIAIQVSTNLKPHQLLETMQSIEMKLGRKREIRWGPRTIDLDILLYNHENIETESLIVPHPRMYERAFVLAPLCDINEDVKQAISDMQLEEMIRREGVTVWKRTSGEGASALLEN
ncbi:2-amino-4-hydroxy-6-hydroxymethyldihydropteridine diphosphokinase [Ectobacillus sp. JY-23]|uniref:2-amino-4-hydroxy-6- hydroxymethyldihydropteridine diphosphokinase n=1 Tax=Ectobacillus sp. JY-23 TaxID=2933872 RepID=UPI001FF541BC|nr:2-amino-4-hydroxy-6-hydroxymethyldihydropteridine diphosphokinase [Ectobacillus sp. JY-23]UOY91443.1 2-amino-4-hydroxy-6-hydroxymethyldihydropteridine diphosphokinase [Ectobacillus sp. JY-23]